MSQHVYATVARELKYGIGELIVSSDHVGDRVTNSKRPSGIFCPYCESELNRYSTPDSHISRVTQTKGNREQSSIPIDCKAIRYVGVDVLHCETCKLPFTTPRESAVPA